MVKTFGAVCGYIEICSFRKFQYQEIIALPKQISCFDNSGFLEEKYPPKDNDLLILEFPKATNLNVGPGFGSYRVSEIPEYLVCIAMLRNFEFLSGQRCIFMVLEFRLLASSHEDSCAFLNGTPFPTSSSNHPQRIIVSRSQVASAE